MKKVIWLTGIVLVVFLMIVGCYLLFFREKKTDVREGTFVRTEGVWNEWQQNV